MSGDGIWCDENSALENYEVFYCRMYVSKGNFPVYLQKKRMILPPNVRAVYNVGAVCWRSGDGAKSAVCYYCIELVNRYVMICVF